MTPAAVGRPRPISGHFANVVELFDAVVATDGDREAFVDSGQRLTFREWADAGDRVAGWLHDRGVVKGEIVPLLREYWFDNADKASEWEKRLMES